MSTVARPVGYVGLLQRLTWNFAPATVQAYLWGAGGGGGGDEGSDDPGGNGGGGGFARYDFTIQTGQVIDVAIGQGGQGGTRTPGTVGGAGGRSVRYLVFDTRDQSGVVPVTNGAWSSFMNNHAVWDPGGSSVTPIFRSYTVNFPVTGYYVFQYAVDDVMSVDFDGVNIISYSGFTADPPPFISRLVTAGNHTLNITANNSGGGPAGVSLTIDASFSGGNGGDGSGGSNGGGSGGGGGGATVLLINDEIVAVAGGGAGGGGGGGNRGAFSPNAPGPWLWPPDSGTTQFVTLAQDGQGSTTGGGGGGAGGGQSAGNGGRRGGATPSDPGGAGDQDGTAGSFGKSSSTGGFQDPNGRFPGAADSVYYTGASVGGFGGSRNLQSWNSPNGQPGSNGYAAFVMDISGLYVRNNNIWTRIREQYIREQNQWKPITNIYVRDDDTWKLVYGTRAATFGTAASDWGQYSRRAG